GAPFAPPEAVMPSITLYFLIYGLVIGAVGSLFSIRRFLDA
ncbi:MAG TPA: ABC transporter permease, partial [Eubacteriaceae bacterium]|nr:ABC transporter permease [Eubacteriaceae bacterium]